jgi:hypothetical protein
MSPQDRELALEPVGGLDDVAEVAVLSDELERDPLAASGDQHGDVRMLNAFGPVRGA